MKRILRAIWSEMRIFHTTYCGSLLTIGTKYGIFFLIIQFLGVFPLRFCISKGSGGSSARTHFLMLKGKTQPSHPKGKTQLLMIKGKNPLPCSYRKISYQAMIKRPLNQSQATTYPYALSSSTYYSTPRTSYSQSRSNHSISLRSTSSIPSG